MVPELPTGQQVSQRGRQAEERGYRQLDRHKPVVERLPQRPEDEQVANGPPGVKLIAPVGDLSGDGVILQFVHVELFGSEAAPHCERGRQVQDYAPK